MQKFAPQTKWVNFIGQWFNIGIPVFVLICMVLLMMGGTAWPSLLLVFLIGFAGWAMWGIISYFPVRRTYQRSGYKFTPEGIRFRKGLFRIREYFVPYEKIKTVDYKRGGFYPPYYLTVGFRGMAHLLNLYGVAFNPRKTFLGSLKMSFYSYRRKRKEIQFLNQSQAELLYQKVLEHSQAEGLRE